MRSLAETSLYNREPLVVEVYSKSALKLSIVRQRHHACSHQIKRHGKASEKGN